MINISAMVKQLGYIVSNNTYYITDTEKIPKLPAGVYNIDIDQNNTAKLVKLELNTSYIVDLPNLQFKKLQNENRKFWSDEKKYKEFNLQHKRGFLLHGKPGCGQTTSILKLCEQLIESDCLIFFVDYFDEYTKTQLKKVREAEPERSIAIILDHLDIMLYEDGKPNIPLIDFLDGHNGIDNVLFLATTISLNNIPDWIKKRPSRFDLILEIKLPDDKDREFYFKKMIPESKIKEITLEDWITKTEGYTVSHLKELVASYFVYQKPFDKSIKTIDKLIASRNEVGFNAKSKLNSEEEE